MQKGAVSSFQGGGGVGCGGQDDGEGVFGEDADGFYYLTCMYSYSYQYLMSFSAYLVFL